MDLSNLSKKILDLRVLRRLPDLLKMLKQVKVNSKAYYLNIFCFTIYGHGGGIYCFFSTEYTIWNSSSNSPVISEERMWQSEMSGHGWKVKSLPLVLI